MENPGKKTMLGLLITSAVLLAIVIYPFYHSIFVACVLAGALYPLFSRLSKRLKDRRHLAAGLITAAVVLALVLPLAGLSAVVISEVIDGFRFVRSALESGGAEALIAKLPSALQNLAHSALGLSDLGENKLRALTTEQGGKAAAAVGAVLMGTGEAAFQTVTMLIAFFFLLVDGPRLLDWLGDISPLRRRQMWELITEFKKVSVSVLVSTILVSAVQAAAAFVGFLIARVPSLFFFTVLTFFVSFIPAVGAGAVVLAVALLIGVTGHVGAAIFLAIWGVVVVGLVDNLAKPLLIKGDVEMHGAVVFFALLGGLAIFGIVGLLAGPLIVSLFMTLLRMYRRDYQSRVIETPSSTTT